MKRKQLNGLAVAAFAILVAASALALQIAPRVGLVLVLGALALIGYGAERMRRHA